MDKRKCKQILFLMNKQRIEQAIAQNQQNDAFIYACECGEVDFVKELLKNPKVDPSVDDHQAFKMACQNGHLEVVRVLLNDSRIDYKAENWFGFKFCCQQGNGAIVQLMLPLVDEQVRQSGARLAFKKGFEELAKSLDPLVGTVKTNENATKARIQSNQGWARPTGEWMQGNSTSAGR